MSQPKPQPFGGIDEKGTGIFTIHPTKGGNPMKTRESISWVVIFIVAILVLPALGASAKEKGSSAIPKAEALSKLSKLHIPFLLNRGQVDKRVKYYARTFGGTVFVTEAGEMFYSLPKKDGEEKTLRGWVLKEELLGGSIKGVRAEEEALTRVSYFIGNDASRWKSNISTYGTVSFGEVYEGIGVKAKAYGKSVEKLFYVRPGAKPGLIRLRLSGAESLGVNGEGELEVRTGLGEVRFSRPVAYQEVEGKKRYVEVSYLVEGNDYGFKLGDYDKERELVIDPLLQSTYLGGSSADRAYSIAIDSDGNVYVAGYTYSTNFPGTAGGYQPFNGEDDQDAFVAKFNPALTTLVQSTYLGGSGGEIANSIVIDSGGNIYVAGQTTSGNFPGTAGGAQPSYGAQWGEGWDAFVTMLNPTLTSIIQSTYLGGSIDDAIRSIVIGSGGNIYVTGATSSTDFPGTAGGVQPSKGEGDNNDAFVTKLNPTLTSIVQSTYLGGSGTDYANSIAIGSGGNVYVAGVTYSSDFPVTAEGTQDSFGGGFSDAFVAKLNPTLTSIVQSTYLGGNGTDYATSIAIDSEGNVYVAGETWSTDFPGTTGGAQPSFGGGGNAFVAKFNPTLTSIVQSTYLGGNGTDSATSIAIGSGGNVYVTGATASTDFPGTAGGAQPSYEGSYDAFVTKLNSALTTLVQSTYLGSSDSEIANSIAIDSGGNVYVAGETYSNDFPGTAGGPQPSFGGVLDAFVARLYPELTEPPVAATLVSPSGTITPTPTYTWNAVTLATEYYLKVNDSKGNRILQWYSASEAGCASGPGICSVTPATFLAAGPGKWWIQTRNSAGTGPLSSPMSFMVEAVSAPSTPEGPKNAETGTSYAYTVRGSVSNVGDSIEYVFDWGDGTNSDWLPVGTMIASHSWTSSGIYSVRALARCATHASVVSPWSKTFFVTVETVSTPATPSGAASGMAAVSSIYSTGGSISGSGHMIQYLFDWGDGTNSGWLPVGKTSASKSWALPGTYSVKAKARCSAHKLIISDWSSALDVSIQKLTVITPNGGEVIPSGGSYTIEWTAFAKAEKFSLQYSMDNGATWKLIVNDIVGTTHAWNPVPVPPGNKTSCYVKVIGYSATNLKMGEDRSDKPFTIGVVELVRPNAPFGEEVLRSGLPYPIEWALNGTKSPVTKVNLYYSTNGGVSYVLIDSIQKVDPVTRPWADSYPWTVPTPPANMGKCYVKVVAYSGNTVVGSDRSAKPFTIEGVTLMQPNGGEVVRSGGLPCQIEWEINGTKSDVTKVNLYYTTNGGASYVLIDSIQKIDPGTRPWADSYPWTVPTPPANMANCYVKIVAYSGITVVGSDRSDRPFTIGAGLRLVNPNGGEFVPSGSNYSVQFDLNGNTPVTKLDLYYSTGGGSSYALVDSASGFSITPPATVSWGSEWPTLSGTRTNCYAKVVAYNGTTILGSDRSDKPFTIGVVKLLGPNGGEVLESGSSYPMQWEIYGTKNPVATVKLYYSMDGGATWSLITTLDGIFRSYDWIPLVQTTKTKCKVKVAITDTKGVTSFDISDGYFTIQP
jgi:hypothetical protein